MFTNVCNDSLESIHTAIADETEEHTGTLYSYARALWNEIERLRTTLATERYRHESEKDIEALRLALIARTTERDEARQQYADLLASHNQSMENVRGIQKSLYSAQADRDEARAEAANLQAAFKALQTHAFNLAKEHEWKLHDHYVCSVLPECLHIATRRIDAARSIGAQLFDGDESFRAAVVTEARALADAAMKAREVQE